MYDNMTFALLFMSAISVKSKTQNSWSWETYLGKLVEFQDNYIMKICLIQNISQRIFK